MGGDKQWVPKDVLRVHDPFLLTRYASRHELTCASGWEWTWAYLNTDEELPQMIMANKASKFLKNIEFGVEVPQSTRQAFEIDKQEGNSL